MKNTNNLIISPCIYRWKIDNEKEIKRAVIEGYIYNIECIDDILYLSVMTIKGYNIKISFDLQIDKFIVELLKRIDYTKCLTIRPTIINNINTINVYYTDEYNRYYDIKNTMNDLYNHILHKNYPTVPYPTIIRDANIIYNSIDDIVMSLLIIDYPNKFWQKIF